MYCVAGPMHRSLAQRGVCHVRYADNIQVLVLWSVPPGWTVGVQAVG